MQECPDILISLAPGYTRAILEGRKTVELRRRRMRVSAGTRIWLYSKAPTARVEGTACVQLIYEADPKRLWSKYSDVVGISRAEFDKYFRGCAKGYAIVLGSACAIAPSLDLATMRNKVAGFHPPQFFKRLGASDVKALLVGSRGSFNGWTPPRSRARSSAHSPNPRRWQGGTAQAAH